MISVYEEKKYLENLSEKFNCFIGTADRCYVADIGDDIVAIAVVYFGIEIIIKSIRVSNVKFKEQFHDLITRSILNIIKNGETDRVIIEDVNSYYEQFGFEVKGEYMFCLNKNIVLKGNCCKED